MTGSHWNCDLCPITRGQCPEAVCLADRPPPPVERLPFFVYGTLRPGCHNEHFWRGAETNEPVDGAATLAGYRLTTNGGFPYALPAQGARCVGTLIHVRPEHWAEVVKDIDRLEGVEWNHYRRIMVEVDVQYGYTRAWLYTPCKPDQYDQMPEVPGNDWALRPVQQLMSPDDDSLEWDYEPSVCPNCGDDVHTPDDLAACLLVLTVDPWPESGYGEDG